MLVSNCTLLCVCRAPPTLETATSHSRSLETLHNTGKTGQWKDGTVLDRNRNRMMKLFPRRNADEAEEEEIKTSARKPLLSPGAGRSETAIEIQRPEQPEPRSEESVLDIEFASLAPAGQRKQLVAHLAKSAESAIVDLLPPPDDVRSGDYGGWWHRGALARDGCIYWAPGGASRVLKMDPNTGKYEIIGPDLGDDDAKWAGAIAVRQPL
jgi:hypothetical protein